MATKQENLMKREILKSFEALPEDAKVEDFIEHLNFLAAVDQGLADLGRAGVISHGELVERAKQWLK